MADIPSDIQHLLTVKKKHALAVHPSNEVSVDGLVPVQFLLEGNSFTIFLYDEFNDFDIDNQLLCVYLVLSSLEDYLESKDFLEWCRNMFVNSNNVAWLQYYRELASITRQIETIMGKIDSFIPHLEYELRSGSFHILLKGDW